MQKEKKREKFAEYFKKLSFKEKCIKLYIPLIFVAVILINTQYILQSIINGEDIFLSTIWDLTIMALVLPVLIFIIATLYYARINKIIAEKIQHKYGISEFTLGAIIMVILVVIVVVVTPIITDEPPLNIAQIVFVILFGILLMFILKKYVFKSNNLK